MGPKDPRIQSYLRLWSGARFVPFRDERCDFSLHIVQRNQYVPAIFYGLADWHSPIALVFIHRNFFVRALRENPDNPMQTRFAPSFLTTYSSAITVLKVIRRECERKHSALTRQWPMWVHTLSSGVSQSTSIYLWAAKYSDVINRLLLDLLQWRIALKSSLQRRAKN